MTVRLPSGISRSSRANAESQSAGVVLSHPVCRARDDAKYASSSLFERPSLGRNPSILMKNAPLREANSSMRVDLPIRRLPLHVTSEGTRFAHKDFKASNCSFLPKKSFIFHLQTRVIISFSVSYRQYQMGTISDFLCNRARLPTSKFGHD